jgi:cardiolipin synthase
MGAEQRHDIYVEITGPSASDVHHNFVQRWNEASERNVPLGVWGHDSDERMPFPLKLSDARGSSVVQIQRNVHAGCYRESHAAPGSAAHQIDIARGERSITDQYVLAINAARRSLYLENQALPVPEIASALEEALKRGIHVVLLVPGEPEEYVGLWRRRPEHKPFFDRLEALGQYDHFTLAGIAGRTQSGGRKIIYVHAKIMLIDDAREAVGSCNLHVNSLFGHSEMNAAVWDGEVVCALRRQLLLEHLGQDTGHLDDQSAMRLFQRIARENTARWQAGDVHLHGLACSLNPATFGESQAR